MTNAEPTAEEQLDTLLREGRITPEDYDTLQRAMSKGGIEGGERRREAARGRLTKKWAGRQLGGVCAGIGEFFGLDAWSVRAAFTLAFLLSGGTALIVYLVLYFTLPWSDRDGVSLAVDKKRRGGAGAFLASLIVLWLFGLFLHLYIAPVLFSVARLASHPLPVPFNYLAGISALWGNRYILGAQVLCLGLVYLIFCLAPSGGALRRGIPRALTAAVFAYCLCWLCTWLYIASMPFTT